MAYIGEIRLFAYGIIPAGHLVCDGRVLDIHAYPKLYMMIGSRFGGEGNQFALPDLRDQSPDGITYCIAYVGALPEV